MADNTKIPEYELLQDEIMDFDFIYKIILIGDSSVGKSCLTLRATKNIFQNSYQPTIGFEFCNLILKIKEKKIKLQIWDTCGQEQFRSLITNYYRNSSLVIIVYSINDLNSYKNIDQWLIEVKKNTNPDIKIFLIGNKSDLEESRKISKDQAKELCNERDLDYFTETSALNGENVINTFALAANMLLEESLKYSRIKKLRSNNSDLKSERSSSQFSFNYIEDEPSNLILDNSSLKNEKKKCC